MGNMENFGQNPQQQQNYQQPTYNQPQQQGYYNPPQGPSAGQTISKNPLSKLGLAIVIIAVIGLILSYTVPWGYLDYENSNLDDDEKWFGHNLENKDEDFLFGGDPDDFKYMSGAPGLSSIGLIFILVMGIVAVILGYLKGTYKNRYSTWFSFSGLIIGAISLIPSLWILTSSMKFVGYNITYVLNESETTYIFPAAYIMLIFGLILFILVLKIIKNESTGITSGMYFFKQGVKKNE